LAAGCTAVIKPSELTPLSALALCAIAQEAGLPPSVLSCITVAREEVEEVGKALATNPNIRKLSFTGSVAVGKWLSAESSGTLKKVRVVI